MRSYRKSSHAVHDLKVHLIWITKYRYKVLTKEIGIRIREIIRQVCDSNQIEIIKGRVSKDHVHIYVSYPPKLSVSEMVRLMKGRSSRRIQEEFPQLSKRYWGKHFWGIGYAGAYVQFRGNEFHTRNARSRQLQEQRRAKAQR